MDNVNEKDPNWTVINASQSLKDQWKEYFYVDRIPDDAIMVRALKINTKNNKGDDNVITYGSKLVVGDGQCAVIVEDGRIVEICAEPGGYTYNNTVAPTVFEGGFGKGLVVLTSAASLRNSPIASALLENVAADRRLREKGIEVLSFEPNLPGGSPAERVSRLRLKFAPGGARKVTATLAARNGRAKGKAEAKAVEEAAVPPSGEVTLAPACALVRNGVVASRLEVALDGEAWTRGTERRLVVVNARDKEAEVSLPFAGGRVLFGAPRNLRTDGGRIRFTIPPLERVVIK